jgi:hypothetical protein
VKYSFIPDSKGLPEPILWETRRLFEVTYYFAFLKLRILESNVMPFRFFLLSPFIILTGVLAQAQEEASYYFQLLPTVPYDAAAINNKGQVAGSVQTNGGPVLYLWFPTPDYGLRAGVHSYSIPTGIAGTFNVEFGIDIGDFTDNRMVYLLWANNAYLYYYRGQFTALYGEDFPDSSDLFNNINIEDNGIIYGHPEMTNLQPDVQ